jgi:hypothetical protein
VGNVDAVPPTLSSEQPGTLRVVPGAMPARELSRLVDISISAGEPEDAACAGDEDDPDLVEEVDVEEEIDRAASAVYALARSKNQRFAARIDGPYTHALVNAAGVRRALAGLLKLAVELAPRGARVAVDARSEDEGWQICVRTGDSKKRGSDRATVAAAIGSESKTLAALSDDIQRQGGLLWVELARPSTLALCFTLPRAAASSQEASHAV